MNDPGKSGVMQTSPSKYILKPTPENVHFGFYSADLKPILTIYSGETVQIETTWRMLLMISKNQKSPKLVLFLKRNGKEAPALTLLLAPSTSMEQSPGMCWKSESKRSVLEVNMQQISVRRTGSSPGIIRRVPARFLTA